MYCNYEHKSTVERDEPIQQNRKIGERQLDQATKLRCLVERKVIENRTSILCAFAYENKIVNHLQE